MSEKTILITGAGRGLGLGFTRKFIDRGWKVFGGARQPKTNDAFADLRRSFPNRFIPLQLDASSDSQVEAAARETAKKTDHLDIIINNAGTYGESRHRTSVNEIDLGDIARTFDVNTLGPLRVTRAFLPLLRKGEDKKLIQITSLMGSIEDNTSGGAYGYRLSKCALNMVSRNFAHDLKGDGILSVVLHPGWVKTDMGGKNAPLDIETSVSGMVGVILSLKQDQSGSFLRYDGTSLPY